MKRLKKGFTLIELLVVIAIIAILATVVILNVAGARTKAARAKVASDMKTAVDTASACVSFGGNLTIAGLSATPKPSICTTASLTDVGTTVRLITDPVENAAATGNWPTSMGAAVSPALSGVFTSQFFVPGRGTTASILDVDITAPNGLVMRCTLTGCTTPANW